MNRVRLSDGGIRRLKPGGCEYTIRDTRVLALGVRVHPSGTRTFVCHFPGTKASLGPAALLTVDEARRECLRLHSEGMDRKAAAPVFAAFANGPWRASWLPRCKPSTTRSRNWVLNTQLLPNFGDFRVDSGGRIVERRANWRWGSRCKSGREERLTTTFTASRADASVRMYPKRRQRRVWPG